MDKNTFNNNMTAQFRREHPEGKPWGKETALEALVMQLCMNCKLECNECALDKFGYPKIR